jgi:hypothetical protein
MPQPSLRYIWNVIAFLEASPDDTHGNITNKELAHHLRMVHDAYVPETPNKKTEDAPKQVDAEGDVQG